MVPYTFYLRDRSGLAPTFEVELFERDDDAIGHARRLLAHRIRYALVEVAEGERRVGEVARSGAPEFGAGA